MKRIFLFFSLIILTACTNAQDAAINPDIPGYRILTTDSVYVTPAKLKKNTKVMIIYFSPDCPHCQHLTMELKQKMKELGDTQIVMITWSNNYDIRAIKAFYKEYGLSAFPNLTVGTEGYTYTVLNYYHVKTTPFIAIYGRNGKMAKSFSSPPKIEEVIEGVKKS